MSELTITQGELLPLLRTAASAIDKRTSNHKPILGFIHLTTRQNLIEVTGTDLEIHVTATVPQVGTEPGLNCLLPPMLINSLCAGDKDLVVLRTTDNGVDVATQTASFQYKTPKPQEWPSFRKDKDGDIWDVTIPAVTLASSIHRVVHATDVDTSKFTIGAVQMLVSKNEVRFTGCDGTAGSSQVVPKARGAEGEILLPTRAAGLLARLIKGDGDVQVLANDSWAEVRRDGVEVAVRLAEGRFPKWENAQECFTGQGSSFEVGLHGFCSVIRQIRAIAGRPTDDRPWLQVTIDDGQMEISAEDGDIGSGAARMPVSGEGSGQCVIRAEQVQPALASLDDVDTVTFQIAADSCRISTACGWEAIFMGKNSKPGRKP